MKSTYQFLNRFALTLSATPDCLALRGNAGAIRCKEGSKQCVCQVGSSMPHPFPGTIGVCWYSSGLSAVQDGVVRGIVSERVTGASANGLAQKNELGNPFVVPYCVLVIFFFSTGRLS